MFNELDGTDYIVTNKSIDKNKLKCEINITEDGRAVTKDGVLLDGLTVSDKISYTVKPITE